ncbi:hypothetical protein [Nonomuraea rubra]|uniref:hypothetical protein n=1 Tax=Nonomuraea rubra TaxID=46180 RepID=UPI0033FE0365
MAGEELDHYQELLDIYFDLRAATCVSWTRIPDVTKVASCFGPIVEPVGRWTFSDASDYRDQHDPSSDEDQDPIVLLAARSGWTIAIEPQGREATGVEVMRRLSAGGEAFCVLGSGSPEWHYCRAGGEPLRVKQLTDDPPAIHVLDSLIADLPCRGESPGDQWLEAAYALAERITGVRLGHDDLTEPHAGYIIRNSHRDVSPQHLQPVAMDPEIAEILADPHGHRRKTAELCARAAAEIANLEGSLIHDALAAAEDLRRNTPELRKQVQELALQSARKDLPGDSSDRTAALHALLGSLDPNDRQAARLASHWAAQITGGNPDQRARLSILQRCAALD